MIPLFAHARGLGASVGALVGLLFMSAAMAGAQQGTIRGRVIDKASNAAIPRVEIVLLSDNRQVTTDSGGRYVFVALPAGPVRLLVRAPFFPPTQVVIELNVGQDLEHTIALDSTATARSAAQSLPGMIVTARMSGDRRLTDFEHRRRTGRGQYLTRDDIEKSGASSIQDAVRSLRGVAVNCGGGVGCFIRMVRAPMQCPPDYVIDRRVDNEFGPSTPIRDIEAVEVYTGPSDVPGEFAGRTAGCGVIVIWTRAGPPRRTP